MCLDLSGTATLRQDHDAAPAVILTVNADRSILRVLFLRVPVLTSSFRGPFYLSFVSLVLRAFSVSEEAYHLG